MPQRRRTLAFAFWTREITVTTQVAPAKESLPHPLNQDELRAIDGYWRAANYCSVGQIYLMDNPLLAEPLLPKHVKPRLLGHFGTTPGLNLIYAHLNRGLPTHR